MLLLPQMFPDPPLDLGRHQDKVIAPQPWGPVTRVGRKKAGIQDAGSTLTKVWMVRMHEAPYFHGFLVNNAFPACTHGLRRQPLQSISWKEPTAKEELNQLESCLIQDIFEPEEGRLSIRNQTFTKGDAGAQTLQGRLQLPMVRYAPFPELTERSSTCPWRKHAIFTATPM